MKLRQNLRIALLATWVAALSLAGLRAAAAPPGAERGRLPLAEIPPAAVAASPAEPPPALADQPDVAERGAKAEALLAEGKPGQAVLELDAALAQSAAPPFELVLLLARTQQALGRTGLARISAERADALRPGTADVHLLLGRLHRAQRRPEAAISHLRRAALAASVDPQVTVALYELGQVLAEEGYTLAAAQALAEFDRIIYETHPDQRDTPAVAVILKEQPYGAIERRLELLRKLELTDELVQAAEQALVSRADEPYLARLYVRTLLDAGQAARAFEFCRARSAQSSSAERPVGLLLSLTLEAGRASGQLDAWVDELAAAVAQGVDTRMALALARQLDEAGEPARSVRLWRALCAAQPASADTAWGLAAALRQSGDLGGALETLIHFVRQNAADAEVPSARLAAWTRTLTATGEFLRLVQDFRARPDRDFATDTVLGVTAAAAGQTELADRLLADAVADRPDLALPHVAWGRALLAEYRWEPALEHATAALDISPQMAAAHAIRAEALSGLDRHAEAEAAYKAAVDADPHSAALLLALARHYARTGNLLAAQRYLQQAWSADPGNGEVLEDLVDSYLGGGKLDIARATLKEAEGTNLPEDVLRRVRTTLRFASAPMQAEHLEELQRQFAEHPGDITTGLKLASGLYLNGRHDEAAAVLEQIAGRAPAEPRLPKIAAAVHAARLDYARAIAVLEELVERYPRRREALMDLANAYLADFRLEEARRTLEWLLALDNTPQQQDELRELLLGTYVPFGDYDAALNLVDGWLEVDPDSAVSQRQRLRLLIAAGRGAEAERLAARRLEPVTARFDEARQRFESATAAARGGMDPTAQAQAEYAKRELGTAISALFQARQEYVEVCLQAAEYASAERALRAWLAEQPGQPKLQEWLVQVLLASEQGAAALELIAQLVPKTPEEVVRALLWRARAHAAGGDLDEAVQDLNALLGEAFIRESPEARQQVQQQLVLLLLNADRAAQALEYCERWLVAAGESDPRARRLALELKRIALSQTDDTDAQVPVLEDLLKMDPHDPGLNNDLGYTWVERGERLAEATKMIRRAVAAEPLNAAFLDSLGWAHYQAGDFAAAREQLARAVRLVGGHDATVHDHLGDAAWRSGDRAAAAAAWQTAEKLLEEADSERPSARNLALRASVRNKLTALERGAQPTVARSAADSRKESP